MPTVDFETSAIGPRPNEFPPKSAGVAVQLEGESFGAYLAYGHPEGNNSTWEKARAVLASIWDQPIITHNGSAFDLAITCEEFDLPWPREWHDTLFELFLCEPHANLSLKPSAERLLGTPPTQRDAVRDWVMANVKCKPSEWGAHISKAPGDLVGQYACSDVTMTTGLHKLLYPKIQAAGMEAAYQRELALAPILWESSKRGVRCDTDLLYDDLAYYKVTLEDIDIKLRQLLHEPRLNLDSNDELAAALDRTGLAGEWILTPGGKRSTAKKNLEKTLNGSPLAALIRYRNQLQTCISTFMEPWLRLASEHGRVFPEWNQVRGEHSHGSAGARTGRVTCSRPNLLNVPKAFEEAPPTDCGPLPLMRRYLLPEEGHVWCRRDYQQQELRVLAHYEDGQMMDEYNRNPRVDFHDLARQLIKANTGMELSRKHVKTTAFSILYGAGAASMAEKLNCTPPEAQALKNAYYQAIPGIRTVQNEIKQLVRLGKPIRTWGGRLYYCEEPRMINDAMRTFEYKLLNYLIQGSAADCTKQALINYHAAARYGVFTVQVYDEVNISVPAECMEQEMRILSDCMADVAFDVPMLSDGSYGPNYQDLTELE